MKKIKARKINNFLQLGLAVSLSAFTFASCESELDSVDQTKAAPVALQFKAANSSTNQANSAAAGKESEATDDSDVLLIQGTNGTLKIASIHFIVDEFELELDKADDQSCDDLEGQEEDDCESLNDTREEFDMGMSFVELPIGQGAFTVNTSEIKAGVYNELEFEIDNLDLDEDDSDAENAAKEAVKQAIINAGYTNWPDDASMVVEGSFESNLGVEVAFKTFIEAEVSIEMNLNPPLDITSGSSKTVTVNIDPAKWFAKGDGTVVDLSQYIGLDLFEIEWDIEGFGGFESEVD